VLKTQDKKALQRATGKEIHKGRYFNLETTRKAKTRGALFSPARNQKKINRSTSNGRVAAGPTQIAPRKTRIRNNLIDNPNRSPARIHWEPKEKAMKLTRKILRKKGVNRFLRPALRNKKERQLEG